jgi:hypothetical protein
MRFLNYMTDLANDYISICSQGFQAALYAGHPPFSTVTYPTVRGTGPCQGTTRHCSQGCSIPMRDAGYQPMALERHHRPTGRQPLF